MAVRPLAARRASRPSDQLVFAKAHDNADQVAGLERALRNIETHRTDAGLFEQQQRVAELKEQVNERLVELQNARVTGKPDKIFFKKQAKLEEAQTKLLAAQRELDALSKLPLPDALQRKAGAVRLFFISSFPSGWLSRRATHMSAGTTQASNCCAVRWPEAMAASRRLSPSWWARLAISAALS
jgi:hypothetical protein